MQEPCQNSHHSRECDGAPILSVSALLRLARWVEERRHGAGVSGSPGSDSNGPGNLGLDHGKLGVARLPADRRLRLLSILARMTQSKPEVRTGAG